jgi:iron complex transport system substrate-binding protein
METLIFSAVLAAFALPVLAQDTRTITDGSGVTVTVPAEPQRITILEPLTALEAALSLGIVPTQIAQRSFVAEWTGDPLSQWSWLEARLAELGADPLRMSADETDFELVAAAAPDLILGSKWWVDDARDRLEAIAPTVSVGGASVREAIEIVAAATGREEEAAQVIEAWDKRIAEELVGTVPEGQTMAILRTNSPGTFTLLANQGYGPVTFFQAAGLSLAPDILAVPGITTADNGEELSLERIDLLNGADLIIVLGFSPEPTALLLANPLFKSVPAVAAGRVLVIEQGPLAQAMAMQSPLNFDTVLPLAKEAAALVADLP